MTTTTTTTIPTYRDRKDGAVHAYTMAWSVWVTMAHRFPSAGWWAYLAEDRVCVYLRRPSSRLAAIAAYTKVKND